MNDCSCIGENRDAGSSASQFTPYFEAVSQLNVLGDTVFCSLG